VVAFATVEDYTARSGATLSAAQTVQVAAYLDDATAMMRRHIPPDYEPDAGTLRAICVAVVRRVMANPGGFRQRTIGGYSETLGEDGGLYLTDDEKEQLLPPPGNGDDPDSDAAYTVGLADQPAHLWHPDPAACWPPPW
jgi:hypothetical protein